MTKLSEMKIDGLPVVDATKPITLHIGQHDIPRSKHRNPAACVAAQACMRDLGAESARIHLSRVFIKMPGKKQWVRYATPGSLRSEIIAFDRGGRFIVGEFELLAIKPSHRKAYTKKYNDKRRRHDLGKKTGKKRINHVTKGVRALAHIGMSAA